MNLFRAFEKHLESRRLAAATACYNHPVAHQVWHPWTTEQRRNMNVGLVGVFASK